jgi:hypothetical protein
MKLRDSGEFVAGVVDPCDISAEAEVNFIYGLYPQTVPVLVLALTRCRLTCPQRIEQPLLRV